MNDEMPTIRPGTIIEDREGHRFCVRRLLSMTEFEVIDIESGKVIKRSLFDIDSARTLQAPSPHIDLIALDENDWDLALDRFRIISPLIGLVQRTKKQVGEVARHSGVDRATIYRWLERFESTGVVSSLLRRTRNDQGKTRTDNQAETIMKLVIRDEFLQSQSISPTRAYREVQRQCRKENIEAPHLSTFLRRLRALTPAEVASWPRRQESCTTFSAY